MKNLFAGLMLSAAFFADAAVVIPTNAMFSDKALQIIQKQGCSASIPEKGKLQFQTQEKPLSISPMDRYPVIPLALIHYQYEAEGVGKFGFVIDFYGKSGKKIGSKAVLQAFKNGKIVQKGSFRIGEAYKGEAPAWITIRALCMKEAKVILSKFHFEYQEKADKNTALIPVKRMDWSAKYSDGLTYKASKMKNASVMFLGDSITIGWLSPSNTKYPGGQDSWNKYFKPMNAVNYGIAADTISNVLWRVTEGKQLACNPKIIVLLIGTNNLRYQTIINSAAETADGIVNLVNVIQKQLPETKIILMGVLPRKWEPYSPDFPISAINAILAKHPWNANVIYRDYSSLLLGKEGKVSQKIFRDGVHLSPAAYEMLAPELAKEIEALQKNEKTKTVGK